ncbi:response regulator [Caulobacter sp. 17J80-11]|nr:response regulator [Caulobacter sp. 17J80-11]
MRMLLETVLEDTDYTFRLVSSPGSAMAALEAEGSRFDALVTNVNLGEGPDGFDIARRAREVKPDIHVIYMSGDAAHRVESEKVPDGVFLPKPFDPNDLLEALHRRLAPPTGLGASVEQPRPA